MDYDYLTFWNVIYMATCIVNGKSYVGQTTQGLKNRRSEHHRSAKQGKSFLFAKALAKYGEDAFVWTVLWTATDEEVKMGVLDELEELTITINNTLMPHGYNMILGTKGLGDYTRKRKHESDENELPKYIHRIPGGYEAMYRNQVKKAIGQSRTMEEKLQVVTEWLSLTQQGQRPEKDLRSRKNSEDNDLPKYIHRMPGGLIARYKKQSKTAIGDQRSREEKLQVLQIWLTQVQAGQRPEKKMVVRKRPENVGLPKYISSIKYGYRVHHKVSGQQKVFTDRSMSLDQKLEEAKSFVALHKS